MKHTEEFKQAKAQEFKDMDLYSKLEILFELSDLIPLNDIVDELAEEVVEAMLVTLDMEDE